MMATFVYTTVDSQQQQAARNALLAGLRTYDWRHGWRGPERRLAPRDGETEADTTARWEKALQEMPTIAELQPVVVTQVGEDAVTAMG
jgi:penicillin-binding protein 1A